MNRMWVRLSLVFAAVVILAMFLLGVTMRVAFEVSGAARPEIPPAVQEFLEQNEEENPSFAVTMILVVVGGIAIAAGTWMSRSLTAPLNELGQVAQAIGEQDLSQRAAVLGSAETRAVALRFNEMAERLEQAEDLRRNLLADVAHELRHPLHVIQGNLQAILDGVYPMAPAEIARLLNQTQHLTTLVNDLHELAQAEAHQLPLHKQAVDAAALAKEMVLSLKPLAEEQGVDLQIELLGTQAALPADPGRLRQALNNLLHNAIIHTPENGPICVSLEQKGDVYEFRVQDSGSGIEAAQLPYVFDRFYRVDNARSRDRRGAGLGLAIVQAIAEAHGGSVVANSPGIDQGSTFIMRLPLVAPDG